MTNVIVSSKIYDNQNDFNFEIDNFTSLDGHLLMIDIFRSLIILHHYIFRNTMFRLHRMS